MSTSSLCKIQHELCMCFGARKTFPIGPVHSYHRRHNPCHASMMLPGTYWALVESILYSSWYLDAAHMDTDRHRLGESGVKKAGKGKEMGKSEKRMQLQMPLQYIFIHLHLESECNHLITLRENLCAARRSKMGSDTMLVSRYSFWNISKS